jgi:hypothetical protein
MRERILPGGSPIRWPPRGQGEPSSSALFFAEELELWISDIIVAIENVLTALAARLQSSRKEMNC